MGVTASSKALGWFFSAAFLPHAMEARMGVAVRHVVAFLNAKVVRNLPAR